MHSEIYYYCMRSQQYSGSSIKEKASLFSKAGKMSLQMPNFDQLKGTNKKQTARSKILQQINNDDQFMQLPNVTTTYLNSPNLSARQQYDISSSTKPIQNNSPKILQLDQSEYEHVKSKIKYSSQVSFDNIMKRRRDKINQFRSGINQQLVEIEQIIGDIQKMMKDSLASSKMQSPFKNQSTLKNHSLKRNFHNKGTLNFRQNKGIDKLQQMLLNYQNDDYQLFSKSKTVQIVFKDNPSRKAKHQERANRIKEYNKLTESIVESAEKLTQSKILKQSSIKKAEIGLENIEILEIDWLKLPIFLNSLSIQGSELLLKMKDYPNDQSYETAINQSLGEQRQYKSYSIFNRQVQAGIKKSQTLMSQQQFREIWAEQWSYEIDEQQDKQLLSQMDFQWYRSLVYAIYNHTLQNILIKSIKYDINIYKQKLKSIHNISNNDKNIQNQLLSTLIIKNKLKYIQAILNKFSTNKYNQTNSKSMFIAVVPNIRTKHLKETIKNHFKEIFVGSIYPTKQDHSEMAVMITKAQAGDCQVKSWEGEKVKIGSVQLLINVLESGVGDRILLNYEKSKNSLINIKVLGRNEGGIELQVGQQLFYGRRYHILLD